MSINNNSGEKWRHDALYRNHVPAMPFIFSNHLGKTNRSVEKNSPEKLKPGHISAIYIRGKKRAKVVFGVIFLRLV